MTSFKRILAVMKKEFIHIINDRKTLLIVIIMPVLQLLIFGYAMNLDIRNLPIYVIDQDHSPLSREFIDHFQYSRYFKVTMYDGLLGEVESQFLTGKAKAVIIIPRNFEKNFYRKPITDIQVLFDAADPNAANIAKNYVGAAILEFNRNHGKQASLPFSISTSVWYNPDLKSAFFFVPGILAMILVMISALLTSIAIAREKELGTMEQILVSPIQSGEIIIGKVLPYVLLAFLDAVLILAIGILFFKVPFIGSLILFSFLTLLYVVTSLSLGILISTFAKSQQTAMMFALMLTLLPTLMLSGFIFPIRSMPVILHYISYLAPAKYYLIIVRGILIKGNGLTELLVPAACLVVMSVSMLALAWKKFKTHS